MKYVWINGKVFLCNKFFYKLPLLSWDPGSGLQITVAHRILTNQICQCPMRSHLCLDIMSGEFFCRKSFYGKEEWKSTLGKAYFVLGQSWGHETTMTSLDTMIFLVYNLPLDGKSQVNRNSFQSSVPICKAKQGCALAEPSGPLWLTFAPRHLESFCQAPWILQVLSTGLPSLFLRAQLCWGSTFYLSYSRPWAVVWPRESNLQPPILQALLLAPLETSNKLHLCAESLVPSSFHYGHWNFDVDCEQSLFFFRVSEGSTCVHDNRAEAFACLDGLRQNRDCW